MSKNRYAGRLGLAVSLVFFTSCPPAQAQIESLGPPISAWILQTGPDRIINRSSAEIIAFLRARFDAQADGLEGVDLKAQELAIRAPLAQRQAQSIGAALAFDLDGDNVVTTAEARLVAKRGTPPTIRAGDIEITPLPEQLKQIIDAKVARAMAADLDGDGRLTLSEMRTGKPKAGARDPDEVEQALMEEAMGQRRQPGLPASLDTNGDQIISPAEFTTGLEAVVKLLDVDADGVVSQREYVTLADAVQADRQAKQKELRAKARVKKLATQCQMLQAGERDLVAYYAAGYGGGIANVAIGPSDEPMSVAEVEIQPGAEPLYLVLRSESPTIWRLYGAVQRVSRLAVFAPDVGGMTSGGVTGVGRDKVTFISKPICREGREEHVAFVGGLIGKPVLISRIVRSASQVLAPTMTETNKFTYRDIIEPPKNPAVAEVWNALRDTIPAGVIGLNPKEIIAEAPVKSYAMAPGMAGMAQLMERGAVEVSEWSNYIVAPGRNLRIEGSGMPSIILPRDIGNMGNKTFEAGLRPVEFRILSQVELPPGLAQRLRLRLDAGVPLPTGNPGGACFVTTRNDLPPGWRRCG